MAEIALRAAGGERATLAVWGYVPRDLALGAQEEAGRRLFGVPLAEAAALGLKAAPVLCYARGYDVRRARARRAVVAVVPVRDLSAALLVGWTAAGSEEAAQRAAEQCRDMAVLLGRRTELRVRCLQGVFTKSARKRPRAADADRVKARLCTAARRGDHERAGGLAEGLEDGWRTRGSRVAAAAYRQDALYHCAAGGRR
jgi:hypothetical protein